MVGERFTVDAGPIAHGGSCVARVGEAGGRVVFTRHALPGERVVVEITEGTEGDRFWRGDAVEVLVPSSDRVSPPCLVAGPGGCGGCDFQHVSLPAQRRLKAEVVSEQLRRLAGLDVAVEVEAAALEDTGLRWRTRVRYASTPDGRRGMRRYRSHEVIPVEDCLLARQDAREPGLGEVVERVATAMGEHDFTVAADGFWQVHPAAPAVLVEAVLDQLRPRAGERAVDLYAGVGLFSAFLADRLGEDGSVLAVEADRTAARHAAANLAGRAGCNVVCAPAARAEVDGLVDLVVLDPPREGARRAVVERVCAWRPRAASYVACDPAALARDLAIFAEHGYRLTALRVFDLFPMTHHVECVALLTKSGSDLR
ncbi:MAG: TRAM domain-containing protein [Nocardioides sp.]|uniref:class I SAM-dependent RNA methyltransferase n=1 Tax=Nocardioides sp. TaxID=35761 RepID=UPI0039E453AD